VRPISCGCNDAVPFHRETLYSDSTQTRYQHNVWIPLAVENLSCLNYIPFSHTLLDEALTIESDKCHPIMVAQYSHGHRIGYPYAPKIIDKTPELKQKPSQMIVAYGHAAIFSSMLVHGNGINKTDKIRFSIDTGFMPTSRIEHNKRLFASRNNPHYVRFY